MDTQRRDRLIDEYYDAVDSRDIDRFAAVFAPEATHFRPGQGTLAGLEEIQRYFREDWRSSETSHTVEKRIHDPDVTVTRMAVSGVYEGEPFDGRFLAEFEFTAADGAITAYRLYRGYER
jgi:ketosteroid isomerase-like protein